MNQSQTFTHELLIEEQLINILRSSECNWTYRNDIKNEEQLWANLRDKLNQLNCKKLNNKPLSDNEFAQVKSFILDNVNSTCQAANKLLGEHGEFSIKINCDDLSLGEVFLTVIDSRDLSKNVSYEVINQFSVDKNENNIYDRLRRFDVSLLINGLPLIHIELKQANKPFLDAYRQIIKYATEGKFKGLFKFVQMFVVSNGSNTRYFAANIDGNCPRMNDKFLTRWLDKDNNPVENIFDFAKEALNSQMAHQLISKYSLLDQNSNTYIILRAYQIHAIEAIEKASQEGRSGYVWHTTGSGKTITSFVVTKVLDDLPNIDKTIFLVDRKDLNQQTSIAFDSYSKSADIVVDGTKNTGELLKKLKSHDKKVIITSIQKLQAVIRSFAGCTKDPSIQELMPEDDLDSGLNSTGNYCYRLSQDDYELISNKRVAFVVDECHRTVTPETKKDLESLFKHTLWYGFTGTPIFQENKRAQKGNLAQTTAELFCGKDNTDNSCLHCYTIKDAMKDNSVLGFMIHGKGVIRDTLEEIAIGLNVVDEDSMQNMPTSALEQVVAKAYSKKCNKSLYSDIKHKNNVIESILNHSISLFNLRANPGEYFCALLTVESIQDAQDYYKLIKKFINDGRISEQVKKLAPDFPRFAITYTVGENEDGALANQEAMQESIADYNSMFNTNYSLANIDAYNRDLNNRLARKYSAYKERSEQLDLVIVVDRLLTGFDAPCLSTIFIDRAPMKPQHLIQAFSRTNRIFNREKSYGHIVTMQSPDLYAEKIDEALCLYSKGGLSDVSAPTYEESSQKLNDAIATFKSLIKDPDNMSSFVNSNDIEELKTIAKAYQKLDRALDVIQVYDEFNAEQLGTDFDITIDEFKSYLGPYSNIIERIKQIASLEGEQEELELEIDYELVSLRKIEVNLSYIIDLIQSQIPNDHSQEFVSMSDDMFRSLGQMVSEFGGTNNQAIQIIMSLIDDLKQNPKHFVGKNASAEIEGRVNNQLDTAIEQFASEWSLNDVSLKNYIVYNSDQDYSNSITNQNYVDYNSKNKITKIEYHKRVIEAVSEFKQKVCEPLMACKL